MNRVFSKESLYGLTAALYSLPFALYMSFCTGLDIRITAVVFAVFALIGVNLKVGLISAQVFAFLPVLYVFAKFGLSTGLVCVVLTAAAFAILLKLPSDKYINAYVLAGMTVMLAFCATALFTTDYFGIGASGDTVSEILRSYRYLGFHPNWRGILYGTITLVIMITYPRGFKKLKEFLPAPAVAVIIPYILNLFLNPVAESTYISEPVSLYSGLAFASSFTATGIAYAFIGALAAALILQTYRRNPNSLIFGAPKLHSVKCDRDKIGFHTAFVYIIVMLAAVFLLKSVFVRIPLPSLAVVLIVAAWQSVDWKNLAGAFHKGFIPWMLVVLAFGCIFILDAATAVILEFLISLIYNGVLVWLKK